MRRRARTLSWRRPRCTFLACSSSNARLRSNSSSSCVASATQACHVSTRLPHASGPQTAVPCTYQLLLLVHQRVTLLQVCHSVG